MESRIKELEAEVRHYRFACLGMEKENEELKDFSNWENHPALKHKVVLDDDFYLSHLYENELIDPDDYTKLKEENEKLKKEFIKAEGGRLDVMDENRVLQKFIAGNYDYEPQVKALISRDWTKEFIENNQERWEEVGLEWGSDEGEECDDV
tara:strand:+ start:92 stop:544 length:453 start_codon:yes stop_codon:yes gene_type:complete